MHPSPLPPAFSLPSSLSHRPSPIVALTFPRLPSPQVDVPPSLAHHLPYEKIQFTLVDCPGHASLIRTIIGGAQIIDLMLLVVDVTKGIQTQTAECLVVGEVSPTKEMVVVLNKTDLLPAATKQVQIDKTRKRLKATLKGTKFADAAIVTTAAPPPPATAEGVSDLVNQLIARVPSISRTSEGPFLFAIDHCFPIKGQGSVMTGTVLRGHVAVNDSLELPLLKLQKKVKSMQMFHRPVSQAAQGDRVGLCVTQLDPKLIERGIAAAPGSVPILSAAIAAVHPIRFFKGPLTSNSKFHVTVGHSTVMTAVTFFDHPSPNSSTPSSASPFDFSLDYPYVDNLQDSPADLAPDQQSPDASESASHAHFALLVFESEIACPSDALLIASRLDSDIHSNTCRMAFHGHIVAPIDPTTMNSGSQAVRVFKLKSREGVIDRVVDSHSLIGRGLFKKETDITKFVGLRVTTVEGTQGTIQSPFGKSGKFKVVFQSALPKEAIAGAPLHLVFKRLLFDKTKQMLQ
ncbi:hypothetical protein CLOM_g19027 [Closterium sp. NIES-68]|nr:hypothetical protein CLOM_g19027 [Closterium sp. NIES-68]GJP73113.1 hypothetical protein CLOP_g3856 [Closterium sp. NIES-67]